MPELLRDAATGVFYRKWDTPPARAVLLVVHGLGAHSERWRFLAEYMFPGLVKCYAIELPGFGDVPPYDHSAERLAVYMDKVIALRGIISRENPDAKVFLVGESLGGLIALLCAARYPERFSGLVCVSPAFKNRLKFGIFDYLKMALAILTGSRKRFRMPFNSSMCTRDKAVIESMESDKREHRKATARLLLEIGIGQLMAKKAAGSVDMPALFQQAGQDSIVDPSGTEKIFRAIRSGDKELKVYPGMYHALTIDTGREEVFRDMYGWIRERT